MFFTPPVRYMIMTRIPSLVLGLQSSNILGNSIWEVRIFDLIRRDCDIAAVHPNFRVKNL